MDFYFTQEQERLKREADEFFEGVMKEAPENWLGSIDDFFLNREDGRFHRSVARRMGEKGWLRLTWPEEYGGKEASYVDWLIVEESRLFHGAPGYDIQGVGMLSRTLFRHATEEQKREFLPLLGSGEAVVCQLWSEPNAGSDMAAMTTRAVEDGDDFVLNGQKCWISGGNFAELGYVVARTDPNLPRHRGLSYFLIDMKTPGITISPTLNMGRHHLWDEVFFDNVRVPRRNMIGEKNRGWHIVLSGMEHERTAWAWCQVGESRGHFQRLLEFCREARWNGNSLAKNPVVRHKLAQLEIELEVGRAMSYRLAMVADKRPISSEESSAAKIFGGELYTHVAECGMEILGLYGLVTEGSRWAPLKGEFELLYENASSWELGGGTKEIQKNIIAERGLGLPRA